jgi:hypothetical protein
VSYTAEVEQLIADPFGGRTGDQVREIVSGPNASAALAHPPQDFLLVKFMKECPEFSLDETRELFEETKRFLIAGELLDQSLAPSLPVDTMWHAWILFTMDYTAFCSLLGGYIHHRPIPQGRPEQPPLEPTVSIMEAAWGPLNDRFWPQELGAFGIMDCKKGP